MTAPQIFTLDGTFYTFDQNPSGAYQRHRRRSDDTRQQRPVLDQRPDLRDRHKRLAKHRHRRRQHLSDDRQNTQVDIGGVPYTITPKSGSLAGGTVSGQFDITQGNVVWPG